MKELNSNNLEGLFQSQLEVWPQARNNYQALANVKRKPLCVNNFEIQVQFNAARIVSSAAKVDDQSIKERRCFLCDQNRPKVQEGLLYKGIGGNEYIVLINPFPIFPKHLTIPDVDHEDQLFSGRVRDMISLSQELSEYVIFYNGPKCGASAPDHMHFQAGNKGFLPIETDLSKLPVRDLFKRDNIRISLLESFVKGAFVFESDSQETISQWVEKFYALLPVPDGESEPMMNVLAWQEQDVYRVVVFVRKRHRPACFFAEGDDNILLSPASVDLGGVFITPLEKDFEKITAADVELILEEVCIDEQEVNRLIETIDKNFK